MGLSVICRGVEGRKYQSYPKTTSASYNPASEDVNPTLACPALQRPALRRALTYLHYHIKFCLLHVK
jgi:hypothetical protein